MQQPPLPFSNLIEAFEFLKLHSINRDGSTALLDRESFGLGASVAYALCCELSRAEVQKQVRDFARLMPSAPPRH